MEGRQWPDVGEVQMRVEAGGRKRGGRRRKEERKDERWRMRGADKGARGSRSVSCGRLEEGWGENSEIRGAEGLVIVGAGLPKG